MLGGTPNTTLSSPLTLNSTTGILSISPSAAQYPSYIMAQTNYEDGLYFYTPSDAAGMLTVECCVNWAGDLNCRDPNGEDGDMDSLAVWQGPDYDDFAMLVLDTQAFEEYYTPEFVTLKVVGV